MLHHSVADHQLYFCWNGDELELQGTAIEEESVSRFSHAGDELIHDSYARADKSVFRLLAQLGHFRHRQTRSVKAQQGKCACYFDGCGRTQSRADRNFSLHQYVGAPG